MQHQTNEIINIMKSKEMKYIVYQTTNENEFQYIGEFSKKDDAIDFARKQTTKCAVTKRRGFCDNPIIYKNYQQ